MAKVKVRTEQEKTIKQEKRIREICRDIDLLVD